MGWGCTSGPFVTLFGIFLLKYSRSQNNVLYTNDAKVHTINGLTKEGRSASFEVPIKDRARNSVVKHANLCGRKVTLNVLCKLVALCRF